MKFSGGPKGRGRGTYTPEALDLFLGGWGKSADLAHYYNLADDLVGELSNRKQVFDTGFWTEYLWKSHLDRKNSQTYEVSGGEARLVAEAMTKLKEIRNFQSHVWHDNAVLGFSAELADWVEEKYRRAKAYLWGVYPQAMGAFELLEQGADRLLFREVDAGGKRVRYITVEGRVEPDAGRKGSGGTGGLRGGTTGTAGVPDAGLPERLPGGVEGFVAGA